ncbi:M24 family metallopeptidase [Bacillus licheniformis]|nr:M24 family metallopeptidase [Bacillus licheniformis]
MDQIAERFITKQGAIPSLKGIMVSREHLRFGQRRTRARYSGKRVLRDGDIISIDIGAKLNGYHGDSAWTYPVGTISDDDQKLLDVTEESLYRGLKEANRENVCRIFPTQYKRMSKANNFSRQGICRTRGRAGSA